MNNAQHPANTATPPAKSGLAKKWLVAILVLTFAFILMPFLLWYMTTFSRPLSDADLASYFTDTAHPRRAQHALSQIADRIISPNPAIRASAKRWYPQVIQNSTQGSDELRVTAAWVMGQDNASLEFHTALLQQLADTNPMVKRNAALSLVRFADSSGHDIVAGMLAPYTMAAPRSGTLALRLKPGDFINPGTLVAHIIISGQKTEVRSEVPGTLLQWVTADDAQIQAGQPILLVDPSPEMAWEALRALFLIGQKDDLASINRYVRGMEGMPPQVQQQAALTAREISSRASQ
jgi:hypothetical protein